MIALSELNDYVREKKAVLLVHIEKGFFDKQQLTLLKHEFDQFPKHMININIKQEKMDILNFISNKNSSHSIVNYNDISKEFNIARGTTYKWVGQLQKEGLVMIKKQGNVKELYITDKGKDIISKS